MSQQRFINFGDTVLADRVNSISTAIVAPGVLTGADLSLFDATTITVGPNTVMLTSLLLVEDSATQIPIAPTSEPKDYTIVYEHINQDVQGGVPAQLLLLEGIFQFDSLANTVVVGWVRYPGGSVPLQSTFLIEAPKLQISNPTTFPSDILLPPYLDRIHLQNETPTPGSITATDVYDKPNVKAFLELENAAGTIQTIVHFFPFIVQNLPPERIVGEVSSELGTSATFELVAEDGTVFSASNNAISNTSGLFESREMVVINLDTTKFATERPYFVSVTSQLNPGKKLFISLVGTNGNFLPF